MGFQSEIIINYRNNYRVNIEAIIDSLLVNGWRLGIGSKIHTKGIEPNSYSLPYSLEGIVSFQEVIRHKIKHGENISFDMSNFLFDLNIDLYYNLKQPCRLLISLLNEDRDKRLTNTIEEISKYLDQIFCAVEECGQIEEIHFISSYDYETVFTLKGEELLSYSKAINCRSNF